MDGDENISCPQCRRPSNIENFEHVEFTATQQWDQLLEIAQQFAAMEGELGPDTSEEEEEENLRETFIDDGDSEARFVAALWQTVYSACLLLVVAPVLKSTMQHRLGCGKTNRTGTTKENRFHIGGLVGSKREGG
jgi:hypothetical protein